MVNTKNASQRKLNFVFEIKMANNTVYAIYYTYIKCVDENTCIGIYYTQKYCENTEIRLVASKKDYLF